MQKINTKELSVTYSPDNDMTSKSLSDAKITDILNKSKLETTNVSIDIIKKNMETTLNGLLDVFECEQLENRKFYMDEIEVSLNVGCEGSVSILSAISGQSNLQSGIVVKLKRRPENN